MTIWKNTKIHKTEESSSNINKDRSGRKRTQNVHRKKMNRFQNKLIEDPMEYQPVRMV